MDNGRPSGPPVPLPFRAWLNRSWIDLTEPAGPETLTPWGVELAWRSFRTDAPLPRFNSVVLSDFRRRLAAVCGRSGLHVAMSHPAEVAPDARTDRWAALCEAVADYPRLSAASRERLVWLLHRLCFHDLVIRLADAAPGPADPDTLAWLRYTTAVAQAAEAETGGRLIWRSVFEGLLPTLPEGSVAAAHASYQLLIVHAKERPDLTAARSAAAAHERLVGLASRRLSRFEAGMLWSRCYRARAFVPMLAGDHAGMSLDMDRAEDAARGLEPATEAERYAAAEILWPVLESRVREAQVLGDPGSAERRARALIDAAPWNSRAWLHLGDALLALERFSDAASVFREAHRLGPPASEVALFNLGQCHEMLDEAEPAMDAYAELLELDPLAVSASRRIASIAAEHGGRYQRWAAAILDTHEALASHAPRDGAG